MLTPLFSRRDMWYTFVIAEAIVLLSIPTLKNLQLFDRISIQESGVLAIMSVLWVVVVPLCCMTGLYILEKVPLFSNQFRYQFGRYGIIGLFNTFLNAAIFNFLMLMTGVVRGPLVILFSVVAFTVVVTQAFMWNKYWTFKSSAPYSHAEYGRFFVVSGSMALINIVFIHIMVNTIGAPADIDPRFWANIALAFTIILNVMGNFFGYRLFVFKSPPNPN
jgi:putative flippase GtrA